MGLKDHLSLPLFQLHHLPQTASQQQSSSWLLGYLCLLGLYHLYTTADILSRWPSPVHTHQPLRTQHTRTRPLLHSEHSANETRMIQQLARVSSGHSYSTRRTVRDRGQDAVKRSSRIFSTDQAVKRTFWVGQRSRPTFAQTNSYSNSYPTGYTHDFVYTSKLPAHALVQTGLTFTL